MGICFTIVILAGNCAFFNRRSKWRCSRGANECGDCKCSNVRKTHCLKGVVRVDTEKNESPVQYICTAEKFGLWQWQLQCTTRCGVVQVIFYCFAFNERTHFIAFPITALIKWSGCMRAALDSSPLPIHTISKTGEPAIPLRPPQKTKIHP